MSPKSGHRFWDNDMHLENESKPERPLSPAPIAWFCPPYSAARPWDAQRTLQHFDFAHDPFRTSGSGSCGSLKETDNGHV
ncbi:MAG: hypothetical protein EOS27_13080 [Mesorhizobium sp.]|nr:MAG: hypothetical protein EOS27_13080 [Mesorhizobium sp.]